VGDLIELTGVSKKYDGGAERAALDGVSLNITAGEFTAIMGPSGSGKSTLLNVISGLDRPEDGDVLVGGQDLGRMSEAQLARFRRAQLGFIFQFFNLLSDLTVLENITLPGQLAGMRRSEARSRAMELLGQLGIAELAGRFPPRLSGGQQQRVAIARALVNRPLLLLADEPTGALDSRTGEQVMRLLMELNEGGQTIVMVTHDARLATAHTGRVVSLLDGKVVDDTLLTPTTAQASDLVRVRVEGAKA
jgi:putative ABC transport system ATP-binding protein